MYYPILTLTCLPFLLASYGRGGVVLSAEDRGSNAELKLRTCKPMGTREAIGQLVPR